VTCPTTVSNLPNLPNLPSLHMSSKREREPVLIQFRLEYVLDDDLSVEKFFMATDARNAVRIFAHSCQKFLAEPNMSEQTIDCFAKAFAHPGKSFLDPPEMIPVPEEIPEYIKSQEEVEQEAAKIQSTKKALVEESSPPADPFMQAEDGEEGSSPVEENIFAAPAKDEKADPAIEHAAKKDKREGEILEARKENEKRQTEYENLSGTVLRLVKELNEKLSVIAFEKHDRWVDKWNPLTYPLPEEELVDSETTED
jgi:hypothetical protein